MKNFSRRISAVVLALTMMTSMLTVAHAEDGKGVFYFSKVSADPVVAGELTTFTVSLRDCDPLSGIGLVHKITDSSGEDVTSSFTHTGNWLTAGAALKDEDGETMGTFERAYTNIVWTDGATHDVNGTVLTMKLTPSTELTNGDYTIVLSLLNDEPKNVSSVDTMAAVPVEFEPFTFTLTGGVNPVTTHSVTFTGDNAAVALAEGETATLTNNVATVNDGSNLKFTVAASEGYVVDTVKAGETELAADETGVYTLSNVTADTTVTITTQEAAKPTYDVTFTSENATVSLTEGTLTDNKVSVTEGGSVSFTVTPAEGCEVTAVTANGTALTAVDGVYTLANVTAATEVTITAQRAYQVIFTGDNATVKVNNAAVTSAAVVEGESVSFTVTPEYGYEVVSVVAGEQTLEADEAGVYTLSDVTEVTQVSITTADVRGNTYTVTFSNDDNATVELASGTLIDNTVSVNWDGSVSFTVTPVEGYKVSSVTANGAALTAVDGVYTLSNVTGDVTVAVVTRALGSTTWDGTIADSFRSGSGTEEDPYIIASADELAYLAQEVNGTKATANPLTGAYFKLTADLNLNDLAWTPIGSSSTKYFQGSFDGGEHTVSRLSINTTSAAGLFGYVGTATICDLVVSGTVTGGGYTGGLIGYVKTSMELINCGNEANVTGTNQVGGLIGYGAAATANSCILTNCYNTGTITATAGSPSYGVGGLVGYLKMGGALTDCYNTGEIVSVSHNIGGLVGYLYNLAAYRMTMDNCFSVGKLNTNSTLYTGALIGTIYNTSYSTVTNSYYLTSAYGSDKATGSTAITEADLATLAEKLGSAYTATTAGTVTFTGEHAKALVNGAEATSTTAVSYPALVWEGITTRDSGVAAFTVAADEDYEVATVTTDDGTVLEADENGVYTLTGVTGNTAVTITTKEAEKASYEVAFTGTNATVTLTDSTLTLTDDNKVTVIEGESVSFTVTPVEGYELVSVMVGETELTVDDNGVYILENVTAATEVTITTQEKSAPAADYTVSLVAPDPAEVEAGKDVTVDVVVTPGAGKEFAAWDIVLTYDPALFTYVPASDTETTKGTITETTAGTLQLKATNDENFSSKTTIATLPFTANTGTEGQTGTFTLTKAKIAVSGGSLESNAVDASMANTSVKIKEALTYRVTFYAEDGMTVLGTLDVLQTTGKIDSAALAQIVVPAVEHKEFVSWKLNDTTSYTAAELLQLTVAGDMSLTATYQAKEYTVTHTGIDGADKATYFAAYEGTIQNYNSSCTYTVTVKAANGTVLYTVANTDIGSNGQFTIPANIITGNVTMEVAKSLGNVAIQVYENYAGGQGENGTPYSLVVVYGTAAGYTYDGTAMYRVAAYDKDAANTISGGKAYAYMIAGTTTADAVEEVLDVADTTDTAHTVTASDDVNGTGTIDIADAQAVRDCYNARNAGTKSLMATYLRADRDADHEVDSDDITIVMDRLTP